MMENTEITLIDRLARMDVKLDHIIASSADHEARLRGLEKFRWLVMAAAGGTTGAIIRQILGG